MAPPKIYDDLKGPLTHEELLRVLSYNPETGQFWWNIDTGNAKAGQVTACSRTPQGYRCIRVKNRLYTAHRLAWFYVTGEWPKGMVDHRDGVKTNNAFNNLREATRAQNGHNSRIRRRNTSGFKGVQRHGQRWAARLMCNRVVHRLGVFDSPQEAHAAYVSAAKQHFGEFARAS
jgi:hypothetical protein